MRKPIRPRAGTRNSIRIQPVPWLVMCSMRPLRTASSWVIAPEVLLRAVDGQRARPARGPCRRCPGDHLRLADGQLVALAAHAARPGWPAPARHGPAPPRCRDARSAARAIDTLPMSSCLEPVLDHAGGDLGALDPADQRRGVGADGHRDRGLVHGDQRQRARVVGVGEGVADHDVRDAGDRDDVAGARPRSAGLRSSASVISSSVILTLSGWCRRAAPGDLLALLDGAVVDAAQRDPAEVGARRPGW